MTVAQAIVKRVEALPAAQQQEVLDFVEFLQSRLEDHLARSEDASWYSFSVASAMRGMEEEPILYTTADLKESFN